MSLLFLIVMFLSVNNNNTGNNINNNNKVGLMPDLPPCTVSLVNA